MRIRWSNVVALGLVLVALWIALLMSTEIAAFLSTLGDIGPGHTPDQQLKGLMAFGLLAVTLVALIRLLLHNDRRDS